MERMDGGCGWIEGSVCGKLWGDVLQLCLSNQSFPYGIGIPYEMECFICFGRDEEPGNNTRRNRLLMLSMSGCHCHPWVHTKCIRQWSNTSSDLHKCPVCRQAGENYTLSELSRISNERIIDNDNDNDNDTNTDYMALVDNDNDTNTDYMALVDNDRQCIPIYQSSTETFHDNTENLPSYVNDTHKRTFAKKLFVCSSILILVYLVYLFLDSVLSSSE